MKLLNKDYIIVKSVINYVVNHHVLMIVKKEKCNGQIKQEELVINECCEEVYNTEKDCKFHILFQNIICNLFNNCQKDKISKIFEILEQLINKNPIA